jgi:putative ATPase
MVKDLIKENVGFYDKGGEQHYDVISAFIKSIRGSDPNAAVYYMARMIAGGEDPKFIARRLVILAAEDIGLANPNALLIAEATFRIVENIGMPEGRIPLSECAIYLAISEKSNSAYMAINKALAYCKENSVAPVPMHLRNAPTSLMKELGYGTGYQYSHDHDRGFVSQDYLPKEVGEVRFYEPGVNGKEIQNREILKKRWKEKYGY